MENLSDQLQRKYGEKTFMFIETVAEKLGYTKSNLKRQFYENILNGTFDINPLLNKKRSLRN